MKWTIKDLELLRKLYLHDRLSTPDIAKHMNRGVGGVRAKISKLGLSN